MTSVEVVESLKYGLKLFAYLLGVVVVGGGGVVLGGVLAVPAVTDGGLTDNLASAEFVGGSVLAALGAVVWFTGLYGITYKLVADAVYWGVSNGTPGVSRPSEGAHLDERSGELPESTTETIPEPATPVGPSPGEQTAREFGPERTVPSAANVSDRSGTDDGERERETDDAETAEERQERPADDPQEPSGTTDRRTADRTADRRADPPERTAEEIAFGTAREGDPDPRVEETAREGDPGDTEGDVEPSAGESNPQPDDPDDSRTPAASLFDESDEWHTPDTRSEPDEADGTERTGESATSEKADDGPPDPLGSPTDEDDSADDSDGRDER